jgi:hypothetical protein
MATLFTPPYFDVGAGLQTADGALLNFFVVGSGTRKNTFTTAAATTAHANPVVADALGVFPAIFLSGDYDWTLQDKNAEQRNSGSVSELATAVTGGYVTKTELAATTGSSLVGFTQTGLGAIVAAVEDLLRDMAVNVKNYGALVDGTNDSVAVQAALDAHSVVYIPPGTCLADVVLNQGNVLIGAGSAATTLKGTAASTRVIEINNSGGFSNTLKISILGMTIDATTEQQTTGIRGASDTIYMTYLTIRDCHFSAVLQYGAYGNFLQCKFDNLVFGYFGSATVAMITAIYLNGQAATEANANNIDNCYIANTSGEGLYLSTAWNTQINNTTIEVTGKEAIVIDGGLQTSLRGVYIERTWEGNTPTGAEAIIRTANNATTGDTVAAVDITGCFIQSSAGVADTNALVGITRVSTTATVTHTAHGYSTSDTIKVSGAVETDYNGEYTITVTDANTYTYTVAGSPATPATGTVRAYKPSLSGYFINDAGSAIVSVRSSGLGSLGTNPIRLSPNNDKVIFSDDNYYPGGFTSFTAPNVVLGGATTLYKNFHETNDAASEAVKILNASSASYATSLLDLQAVRASSSAYNFMIGRSDIAGSNVVQHQLVGNGEAYHRSGVGGGSYATGARPTPANAGTMVWDSTLSRPIWWNGTAWEDATGALV